LVNGHNMLLVIFSGLAAAIFWNLFTGGLVFPPLLPMH
jgi:hypothetical protein